MRRKELPEYSLDDVARHASVEKGVWICFNNGVYDITDFIKEHPGNSEMDGVLFLDWQKIGSQLPDRS